MEKSKDFLIALGLTKQKIFCRKQEIEKIKSEIEEFKDYEVKKKANKIINSLNKQLSESLDMAFECFKVEEEIVYKNKIPVFIDYKESINFISDFYEDIEIVNVSTEYKIRSPKTDEIEFTVFFNDRYKEL